jgi:DNA-binding transcriptional ArsR family regulator
MSRLFPFRSAVDLPTDREPRLVELSDETAEDVFDALSSQTARTMLAALYEKPHTASDLADLADTSVQNAQYHLKKFTAAGLIEVVDTWYSNRGAEMKVYAPVDESLVVFAGQEKESSFRTLLSRFVGAVVLLGIVSLALGRVLKLLSTPPASSGGGSVDRGQRPTPPIEGANGTTPPPGTPTMDPAQAADGIGAVLPPELLFFAGGLLVLFAVAAWIYY